jgi:DinB superfamily
MTFDLQNSIALLSHTPGALNALLRDLPGAWTTRNEGDGTMTPTDVIDHLAFLERSNWMQRLEVVLQGDESQVFQPVNRKGTAANGERSLAGLLDEFARLREQNLEKLRGMNLQPADLAMRAQHPTFGPVTAAQLLATWTAHDMTHLHQISRVLAHQYREAVGPWIKFLGVLHCEGHSAPG